MIDPALDWALRAMLVAVLSSAAWHKLRERRAFAAALGNYKLLPDSLVGVFAAALPVAELGIAAALLLPAWRVPSGLAAVGLITIYTGAITINLARGRNEIDCGCAGSSHPRKLGYPLLIRNLVLLTLALVLALPSNGRALGWLDLPTIVGGGLALWMLYSSSEALAASQGFADSAGHA